MNIRAMKKLHFSMVLSGSVRTMKTIIVQLFKSSYIMTGLYAFFIWKLLYFAFFFLPLFPPHPLHKIILLAVKVAEHSDSCYYFVYLMISGRF